MAEAFNTDLLGDLARQRVVLFVGAGVSASALTASGGRIAGWPAFLEKTAARLDSPVKEQVDGLIATRDYLLACEIMQTALSDDWDAIVTAEFGQIATPSALHRALVALNQRIIITTNFDKLLEDAWGSRGLSGTHYPKVVTKVDSHIFKVLKDSDVKYILKIHGSVDDAKSLVFSRSEYIRKAFGNEHYASFLDSLLLNYTFIYVGFSMDDPAITSLMEMYAFKYPDARPHYIFSPSGIPDNIVEIQKKLRKLAIIQYDPAHNHANLPILIDRLASASREKQRAYIAEALESSSDGRMKPSTTPPTERPARV